MLSEKQELILNLLKDSKESNGVKNLLVDTIKLIEVDLTKSSENKFYMSLVVLNLFSFMKTIYLEKDLEKFVKSRLFLLEENENNLKNRSYLNIAMEENSNSYELMAELNLILANKEKSFKLKTLFKYIYNH